VQPREAHGPFRWGYFALGWAFFALGAVGVVLPVLPTTPFMLLALWGFARSSRRFHAWLYHHPVFGPPLQQFREHRVIPKRVKILASSTMALSYALMIYSARVPTYALVASGALMAVGLVYIFRHPSEALPD
jgi:uncharacterized membrane protein YbaN (DUF454 family)